MKVSEFARYFRAVNYPEDPFFDVDDVTFLCEHHIQDGVQVTIEELNTSINMDEITSAISQLSNARYGGPDKFLSECFIHGKGDLEPSLKDLFNAFF